MGIGRAAACAAALSAALTMVGAGSVDSAGAATAAETSRQPVGPAQLLDASVAAGHVPRGPDLADWVTPPLRHPGRAAAQRASGTTDQTLNWSGEMATGSSFTEVSGEWTVPAVTPSGSSRDSATWIGIGGATRSATGLIQTGTDQSTSTGVTTYSAWYQILPALSVTIVEPTTRSPVPVAPGDVVSAEILRQPSGLWLIQIEDVTRGWTSHITSAYTGTTLTAEWIEEAPTLGSSIETLADFDSVRFTHMKDVSPGAATLVGVQLVDRAGTVLAFPGTVQPTTTRSVTVYYSSTATPPTSTPPASTPPTSTPPTSTPPTSTPPRSRPSSGYDLVGADGGVFVFDSPGTAGGYYGSLPGIHVVPKSPIVAMVTTVDDKGYYLVASDGGVFAFGDAPYLGSLPGQGLVPSAPITGMVAADTDHGYFLVGRDGGVFSFGSVPFLGSLPAEGVTADDIVGIASTPGGGGYWIVASSGRVYAFGAARHFGTPPSTSPPVSSIAGTATGGGYWVTTANGTLYSFGNAHDYGTLPSIGVSPAMPVIGVVRTADTDGYWLIARDGGVFAFGDAPFVGALPKVVHVKDIVGAVATSA